VRLEHEPHETFTKGEPMAMRRLISLTFALLAGGCAFASIGTFQRTGDQHFPARAPNCDFAVYTVPPEGFVEVGVVDFKTGPRLGALDLDDARQASAPHVCAAGGDGMVIDSPEGKRGLIPRATIIKKTAKSALVAAPVAVGAR
jgi:hypothetical protein